MPPKSSATASVAKNIFNPSGTRLPNIASTPNEKAMSVAIGIAQPRNISASAGQHSRKMMTGTSIPPHAPMIGRIALRHDESSPAIISRLISKPTERKKIAIRKSLIS